MEALAFDAIRGVGGLLDSLDHVKGACLSGREGVKPSLIDVMERPVRDAVAFIDRLQESTVGATSAETDGVIDFRLAVRMDEPVAALRL